MGTLKKNFFEFSNWNGGDSSRIITRRLLPTQKGDLWIVPSSKTILEKFVDTIKKEPIGFTVSPADPCMLFKENDLGICIIIMYVDDMLIFEKKE